MDTDYGLIVLEVFSVYKWKWCEAIRRRSDSVSEAGKFPHDLQPELLPINPMITFVHPISFVILSFFRS